MTRIAPLVVPGGEHVEHRVVECRQCADTQAMTSPLRRATLILGALAALSCPTTAYADVVLVAPANGSTVPSRITTFSFTDSGTGDPSGCPSELYIGDELDAHGSPRQLIRTVDISEAPRPLRIRDLPAGVHYWDVSTECNADYLTHVSATWRFRVPVMLRFDRLSKHPAIRLVRERGRARIDVRAIANIPMQVVPAIAVMDEHGHVVFRQRQRVLLGGPGKVAVSSFEFRRPSGVDAGAPLTFAASLRSWSGAYRQMTNGAFLAP